MACNSSGRTCYFLPRIKAGRPRRTRSPKRTQSVDMLHSSSTRQPTPAAQNTWPPATSRTGSDTLGDLDWAISPTGLVDADNFSFIPENDLSTTSASYPNYFNYTNAGLPDPGGFATDYGSLGKLDMPPKQFSYDYLPTPSFSVSLSPSISPLNGLRPCPNSENAQQSSYLGAPDDFCSSRSIDTVTPSFTELLRKCSEMDFQVSSLHDSKILLFDADTSTPTSKLSTLQHALDISASMILKVATNMQMASPAYSSGFSHLPHMSEGPVDNISLAALFQKSTNQSSHAQDCPIEPASVALSLALAFKVIDICDFLATAESPDRTSHHHLLFLKRLDLSISQIRSALSLIRRHPDVTQGCPPNDAMNRATGVKRRIHSAMKDALMHDLF